ncbi:MAG: hypothetical protein A2170_00110 [Deltaproteobacteria bacterium RBG_13_53_10]|nr:MAG: hypothetical protein A2170_00110 [Deltaproteobacteria bacterium RBG_13_53_10]
MLKALVTGATGFIGSHLAEALCQKGIQVRCLVRKTSHLNWLKPLHVEMVRGDCNHPDSLAEAVEGVDEVFHLAGVTRALEDKTYFEVNGLGTENLVHACLKKSPGLRKFIYLSSQAAAGPCRNGGRKKESDRCEPVSSYGQSKRMGEEMALAHSHEIPLIILRPCSVYGPRDRDLYAFFRLLSKRIRLCLAGADRHVSLCYIRDMVDALLLAAESPESKGEIFFISDGRAYQMQEVGEIIARAMGISPFSLSIPRWTLSGIASVTEYLARFSGNPPLLSKGKVEEMVQRNWVCDISKARDLLGFEPKFELQQGAKLTFDWYKEERWL